ncbi:tRNA (guanosine(18)-2'-O)-methyltransferase TrmH [Gemmatimonadota bacterium]
MNPDRFHRIRRVLARRQPDLSVLMEKVHKTHNLSAIVRSCDAVGVLEVHAVFPKKGLHLHPNSSAGTSKWVAVKEHESVESAVEHLHQAGFRVLAAHPSPEARDFREVDFTRRVALMVGAELDGISERGLALADEAVAIPMAGMVRSLNVSVATALLLFEALRQRKAAGMYDESRLSPQDFQRILFEWAYPEMAQVLRNQGEPYPSLSPDGELLT